MKQGQYFSLPKWENRYDLKDRTGELEMCIRDRVCDAAGVNPYDIHTWEDFTDACETIKAAGYTPISVVPNPGLLANIAGTWVSYEGSAAMDSAAMLDGLSLIHI